MDLSRALEQNFTLKSAHTRRKETKITAGPIDQQNCRPTKVKHSKKLAIGISVGSFHSAPDDTGANVNSIGW